jgi:hypothetical protein
MMSRGNGHVHVEAYALDQELQPLLEALQRASDGVVSREAWEDALGQWHAALIRALERLDAPQGLFRHLSRVLDLVDRKNEVLRARLLLQYTLRGLGGKA